MSSNTESSIVDALDKAISIVGSQQELAKRLGKGYSQQKISYWRKVGRIPAEHAVLLERVTGVSKQFLCPLVFQE